MTNDEQYAYKTDLIPSNPGWLAQPFLGILPDVK